MSYIYRVFRYISSLFAVEEKKKKFAPSSRHCTPPRFRPCNFGNVECSARRYNNYANAAPARTLVKATPAIRNPYRTPLKRSKSYTPFKPREFSRDFSKDSQISVCDGGPNLYETARDSHTVSPYEGLQLPVEFSSALAAECGNCGNAVSNQGHAVHLRKRPFSHPDVSCKTQVCTKIPVRSQSGVMERYSGKTLGTHRHRSLHTLKRNPDGTTDHQRSKTVRPLDIGNWIAYRNDTTLKFERVFKSVAKKKLIIDVGSHISWMVQAGLTVDEDGSRFKQFAGRKIVLTFGEYKFLIHKLCCLHDLDYWDVLRKMATFQGEDLDEDIFYPFNEN